ncbi:MAG: hypothetical protein ACRDRV_20660, partial [Pseudonocardiaceae bacterium]
MTRSADHPQALDHPRPTTAEHVRIRSPAQPHSRQGTIRVLLDGTPLLGQRSGIGHYTAALVAELASRPDGDLTVTVTAFTARGQAALRAAVPP